MFRKRLAATFLSLVVVGTAGVAFAEPPAPVRGGSSAEAVDMNQTFSGLHAVSQWATKLSEMADTRAKSDLVKSYARDVARANANADAKLMTVAKNEGIEVGPLDTKTEQGKSVVDRMKAEATLLGSLEGDAFDKEYMTLVTNTQQSVIHVLTASNASTKDPEVKQFLGETKTTVEGRLKTAQDIMVKVYGDKI